MRRSRLRAQGRLVGGVHTHGSWFLWVQWCRRQGIERPSLDDMVRFYYVPALAKNFWAPSPFASRLPGALNLRGLPFDRSDIGRDHEPRSLAHRIRRGAVASRPVIVPFGR